jgi:hypothetical protein
VTPVIETDLLDGLRTNNGHSNPSRPRHQ